MKQLTMEDHMKAIDSSVDAIAHVRRMAELQGENMEEFDKGLNKLCEEKHKKFAEMDDLGIALYGLKILMDAGKADKIAEVFKKGDNDGGLLNDDN